VEQKSCADLRLLPFVHRNIKYPASVWGKGLNSFVVVGFIVEKDGTIGETTVIKGPEELGAAAIAAVLEMNEQNIRWKPGKQGGRNVRVAYHLPVRFCLFGG
jgi:protein TonB